MQVKNIVFNVYCVFIYFFLNVALQFGLSLLYALLSQGERLLSSDLPMEPSIGDFETWYRLCLPLFT